MPRGKSSPKLAIPVDQETHALVLTAATRAGLSGSAWMTMAAQDALVRRAGLAAVAAWEKQHGELTGEEMKDAHRSVQAQLGRAPAKTRRSP